MGSQKINSIYLISLAQDIQKRNNMENQFPATFPAMTFVDAVNGSLLDAKSYCDCLISCFKFSKKIITPNEVGCTLSHVKVLEMFLKSNNKYALILEDDVIGTDDDINNIFEIAEKIPNNSLLICGGQEGMRGRHLIYGKFNKNINAYKLSNPSKAHVSRTCCYVVTQKTANVILNAIKNNFTTADDWYSFNKFDPFDIYLSNLIKHPENLNLSSIELERSHVKNMLTKGFFNKSKIIRLIKILKNLLLNQIYRLLNYRKIY